MPTSSDPSGLRRALSRRQPVLRLSGLCRCFLRMAALARQRRKLGELPDHLLEDVGISRETALREAQRPIWDPPHHWTLR